MSRSTWRGIIGTLLVLAAWEGAARGFQLPAYTLPAVSDILAAAWRTRAALIPAGWLTMLEALSGYAVGSLLGIGFAVLMAVVTPLRGPLLPVLMAINSVPVAAYSPLVLLWFGIGVASKVVMVALAVGFTVFLSALAGFDRVDRRSVDLMRSFGAGRAAILWRLRLPAALPLIATGMRVSTVRSLIVAIVTEMLGAYGGLGWIIYQAVVQIDFVQVWSAILVASCISLAFFGLVGAIERRVIFWR
ncbi:ABC transporter permease [Rhodovarius crocodyli]|uniref:ABC transporter permease n=1 Tax=Rhodovarius crocodyli TaxID=1979269 RepID=A0A437MCK4_9PROT|nr:ABC transporter permease [Rhodovarius crocodyli]RVT95376.1 ABC transporter permease [Rhodovarius crocodyli]